MFWKAKVEKAISKSELDLEKKKPITTNSAYVHRPDFVHGNGNKIAIWVIPKPLRPRDVALFCGIVSGSTWKAILLTKKKPDKETIDGATQLDVRIISGKPDEVVESLRSAIGNEREGE